MPKALEDLQGVKSYISEQVGTGKAKTGVKKITSAARQLEIFSDEGPSLEELIDYPTD